jgi:Domain of unknown function (DUF4352)
MQGMRKLMSQFDPSQSPQSQWRQPSIQTQAEWQQPPSQPLQPQHPVYQQSFQRPPPKNKSRNGLWVTISALVTMIAILGVAIGWQGNSQPATSTLTTSSGHHQQSTRVLNKPTPQPTLVIHAIGKPVVVDSTWTVTVNSVKTSSGDHFSTPGTGNIYLVVDVTVKNTSSHYQDMLSALLLILKDSAGQQHVETITDFATPPDGLIKFGDFKRGQLAYEIPITLHTFSYYFQTDSSGTNLTEWALNG